MRLAFVTAALASAIGAALLVTLAIWVVSVLVGSADPWSAAPWLIAMAAVAFGAATYLAERITYQRSMARMRAVGEPWAYREG